MNTYNIDKNRPFEDRHRDILKLQYYMGLNKEQCKGKGDMFMKMGNAILVNGAKLEDLLLEIIMNNTILGDEI